MIKIINKTNPSTKSFNEAGNLISEVERLFEKQVKGKEDIRTIIKFIKDLIENQDEDGYWRLILSDDMPYDAIVEYWKYPTILFTSILINFKLNHQEKCSSIDGFEKTFIKALNIVEKGKLSGHGFDAFSFMIKSLKILVKAGVMDFIKRYPTMNSEFTNLIKHIKFDIESFLSNKKTIFDYNEDFKLRMEEIIDIMNVNNKVYLFVYGTLMRGNRQGQIYLNDGEFKGECTLNGFTLYDLGHYPGIVKDEDGKVKGELYAIPESKLAEVDIYEAEGTLYRREMVKVYSNTYEPIEAYVYVYNQSITGMEKVEYNSQPWYKVKSGKNEEYIWYACYGSNVNKERFMKYIRECGNNTPPVDEKQFMMNHPIYFSSKAKSWSDKGVAFLDISKEGLAYGRIYLITKDQFVDVKYQEGSKYNQVVDLGSVDGISVKTFTHSPRYMEDNTPSKEYVDIIKDGIKETYCNLSEIDIDVY